MGLVWSLKPHLEAGEATGEHWHAVLSASRWFEWSDVLSGLSPLQRFLEQKSSLAPRSPPPSSRATTRSFLLFQVSPHMLSFDVIWYFLNWKHHCDCPVFVASFSTALILQMLSNSYAFFKGAFQGFPYKHLPDSLLQCSVPKQYIYNQKNTKNSIICEAHPG